VKEEAGLILKEHGCKCEKWKEGIYVCEIDTGWPWKKGEPFPYFGCKDKGIHISLEQIIGGKY